MSTIKILIKRIVFSLLHGRGVLGRLNMMKSVLFISKAYKPVPIFIRDLPSPVYVESGADVSMVMEQFLEDEYALPKAKDIKRIIDIGANIGSSSLYFYKKYNETEILAVEPDPHNLIKLKLNTEHYKNIKIIQAAIDSSSGQRTFYSNKRVGMGSSFTKRSNEQDIYTVKTMTLDEVVRNAGWNNFDFLKFDVEGAEWEIFKKRPDSLPQFIIGEFHEDLTSRSVADFISLFPDYTIQKKCIAPHRYVLKMIKKIS